MNHKGDIKVNDIAEIFMQWFVEPDGPDPDLVRTLRIFDILPRDPELLEATLADVDRYYPMYRGIRDAISDQIVGNNFRKLRDINDDAEDS